MYRLVLLFTTTYALSAGVWIDKLRVKNYDATVIDIPTGYHYTIPFLQPEFDNEDIFETPIWHNMTMQAPEAHPSIPSRTSLPSQLDAKGIPSPPLSHFRASSTKGVPNEALIKILNMSCLDSVTNRNFRSVFRTHQPLDSPPVIDNAHTGECILGSGDIFQIDLHSDQMKQCGVRYCSENDQYFCIPIRFPTVRGLRLPEDSLITLQCKPQERVVSHTKLLRINPRKTQSRSASNTASGGFQRNFETQVGLFRRTPGNKEFTQFVTPGSSVQIGEDLLLTATVRNGDGWKYSRMGAITMRRTTSPRTSSQSFSSTAQDFITLVDSSGCRVSTMKSVCPEQPRQINPLVTTFPFRAFMFQDANSGDEMVLSVRILGCLQNEDCIQAKPCEEQVQNKIRSKRNSMRSNETIDWQSFVEFKVVMPNFSAPSESPELPNCNRFVITSGILLPSVIIVIIFNLLLVVVCMKKKKRQSYANNLYY